MYVQCLLIKSVNQLTPHVWWLVGLLSIIFLISNAISMVGREVGRYALGSVRWRASAISLDHPLFATDLPIHKPELCACLFLCVCAYQEGE